MFESRWNGHLLPPQWYRGSRCSHFGSHGAARGCVWVPCISMTLSVGLDSPLFPVIPTQSQGICRGSCSQFQQGWQGALFALHSPPLPRLCLCPAALSIPALNPRQPPAAPLKTEALVPGGPDSSWVPSALSKPLALLLCVSWTCPRTKAGWPWEQWMVKEGSPPLVSSSPGLDKIHVGVVRGDVSRRPVLRSEVV